MSNPVFIYALIDPFELAIRYIGQSIRPKERLQNHCVEQSRTWRTNWIRSVVRRGRRPILTILDVVPAGVDWRPIEREWIATAKRVGCALTNCTEGGDGVPGLPPEIRARLRLVWLGRKHKPETMAKLGSGMRGRHHSPEHRERMSRIMKGRTFTEEWRRKIANGVSKLTPRDAADIRALLSWGFNQYDLAEAFGVHQGTISNIKLGKFYVGRAS